VGKKPPSYEYICSKVYFPSYVGTVTALSFRSFPACSFTALSDIVNGNRSNAIAEMQRVGLACSPSHSVQQISRLRRELSKTSVVMGL
jgi:hypothetical protein